MTNTLDGIGMTSLRTRSRLISRLHDKGITNEQVLSVMQETPRHVFVDEALASRAYEDTALPIGHGQTISQPYIVARMTEAMLSHGTPNKVLEVGTGSGYQTALLAQLVETVFTVERIAALSKLARERIHQLGIRNVRFKHTDGIWGWPQRAPYDAIMVTAAPQQLPESLFEQLAVGGNMIIPMGRQSNAQKLLCITRTASGFKREDLEDVSFVPLVNGVKD